MRNLLIAWLMMLIPSMVLAQDAGVRDAGAPDAATSDVGVGVGVDVRAVDPAASRISAIFGEIDGITNVEVSIRNGVATLKGEVESAQLRDDAGRIASQVDGVVYVQNRLAVASTTEQPIEKTTSDEKIQQQLNAIFDVVPALENVRARVESGVVHLEGETVEPEATSRAVDLARSVEGVIFVDNRISESTRVTERLEPAWDKSYELGREFIRNLPILGLGLIILILFWFASRFIARALPLPQLENTPLARDFVRQLIRWVLMIVGLFVVLEILGVTSLVAAVMGTAGIAGIGIGFAFKDIVENYLAGIILGMRQPFNQNDLVDIGGFKGKVVRLTSRETVLMTLEGNHLSVPNSMVFKGVLYNYTRNPLRRFDFVVGVNPGEDFKRVLSIGMETLNKTKGVRDDPAPQVLIEGFGDYTINVQFFGWLDQREFGYFAVWSEAMRRVNEAYGAAGIDMPEPMQRITQAQAPPAAPAGTRETAPSADDDEPMVNLDARDAVDDQIDEERAKTGEKDLLDSPRKTPEKG